MPIINDIVTEAGKRAAVIAVEKAMEKLTQGRSCVIEFDNLTDLTLRRISDSHESGKFSEDTPAPEIPPRSADVFGSQSDTPAQGAIGQVVYEGDGIRQVVFWSNPFLGSNNSSTEISGPNTFKYEARHLTERETKKLI
jgi:hypothetical protein